MWSGDTGDIGRLGGVDGHTVALTGCHMFLPMNHGVLLSFNMLNIRRRWHA